MGLAFLITTENLQLLSERKVLKEAEYAALLDATELVEVARSEAQRITQQAEQRAREQEREGFSRGLEQGKAAYAQRLASEAMATERQLRELRSSMASILVQALGQFIGDADPVQRLEVALRRIDGLVRQQPFVALRVAPAQEAQVRSALARLAVDAPWAPGVAVQVDAALADGACVVTTAAGTLEIGVDAQLAAFRRAVEGAAPAAAPATERAS